MTISSRTPEGAPHRCPVCGQTAAIETSYPNDDSCCPACGHLLWWFRDRIREKNGLTSESIMLSSSFAGDLGIGSLDMVEWVMELEEEFDLNIPDDVAERLKTIEDVIRYLRRRRDDDAA